MNISTYINTNMCVCMCVCVCVCVCVHISLSHNHSLTHSLFSVFIYSYLKLLLYSSAQVCIKLGGWGFAKPTPNIHVQIYAYVNLSFYLHHVDCAVEFKEWNVFYMQISS